HGRIAFGFAGGAGLRQRIVRKLNEMITPEECGLDIALLRPKLHRAVNEVQHEAALEQVRDPSGRSINREPNIISGLSVGVSDRGKPWIYEVAYGGREEEHDLAQAIGTGSVYATCTLMGMRFHALQKQKDDQLALLACRVVAFASSVATADIGFQHSHRS
ncbi:MAG: hypothetical protein ACRDPA_25855, partial [Solirubrobacteraceae bacterium]